MKPDPTFTVDSIERGGAWFWFTLNAAGRMVLWNDRAFPSPDAAANDAWETHLRWRREHNLTPYAGAI